MDDLIARMNRLTVGPGQLGVYFLGQVGVALRGPDGVIFIDPYLTDNDGDGGKLPRTYPSPLAPDEVTNAAAVLVTHEHIDHFDPATLGPIARASPGAYFYGPHPCDFSKAEIDPTRVTHPAVLTPFQVGSATVTALPSAHTELEYGPQGFSYFGYRIQWNGVTLYHAGDTVIWDGDDAGLPDDPRLKSGLLGLLKQTPLDLAFVPINGRDYFRTRANLVGNTDHREAAHLAEELDVRVIVPTHYDLIEGNTSDPSLFTGYLYGLNKNRFSKLMRPGELYLYQRE